MARGPPRHGRVPPSQVGSQPAGDEITETEGGWGLSRAREPLAHAQSGGSLLPRQSQPAQQL